MMVLHRLFLGLGAVALFSSCSHITVLRTQEMKAESSRLEQSLLKEIRDLRQVVDSLRKDQSSSQLRVNADLDDVGKRVDRRGDHLNARLEEIESTLARLGQQVASAPRKKSNTSSSSSSVAVLEVSSSSMLVAPQSQASASPSASELTFTKGKAEFAAGRYKEAYKIFMQLYSEDSSGLWQEQSLYWMAQCQELTGSPAKAVELYEQIVKVFPQGGRVCASKWALARLSPDKETVLKKKRLEELLATPACQGSNEAALAQDELKEL
jgi:TolA-binding protein